ncbi:extracellular catalytic domain type 1 short-chain-length polyhydroxyalkanoate depolymerase [Litorilituus lipolyticus]|uniref:PHB depolymerase family esterase n=1 Tax=Litorilituus lipolyticus TaxID=2491017 RepID=A0A502KXA4_9GAMM|nr:PHB depolymerase family esterase [Litorilituus lipolyticus]TPH14591.1 PHB depolymerase family esterase [Litorilituus lipolyticus]
MFFNKNKYFYLGCYILALLSFSSQATFKPLVQFGENPGDLAASYYQPEKSNAIVVLLHGCLQNAESLAEQSDFLALAKQHQFTLLLPQQSQQNNVKSCFNWFSKQDTSKDQGELLSLKNMITTLQDRSPVSDTYVAGLSAGGAMASALLVNYPEMFTSGAIIAGLPYPCADNLVKAISCMRNGPSQNAEELSKLALSLNKPSTKWPSISIWTGKIDSIVNPKNSSALANQWALILQANEQNQVGGTKGFSKSIWSTSKQANAVELIEVDNIGHGIMINSQIENGGTSGNFLLESPISSVKNIVSFWQLNANNP